MSCYLTLLQSLAESLWGFARLGLDPGLGFMEAASDLVAREASACSGQVCDRNCKPAR